MKRERKKNTKEKRKMDWKTLGICMLCAVLAYTAVAVQIFGHWDKKLEDTLYHRLGTPEASIHIIGIDDETMNQLGDFSEWERSVYTDLLEKLYISEEIRPAAVGFDILFSSQKNAGSDLAFAKACEAYGNIVTASMYDSARKLEELTDGTQAEHAEVEMLLPYEALRAATEQGIVNAIPDEEDGLIRDAHLYFRNDLERIKSFDAAVYEIYAEQCGKNIVYPTDLPAFTFRYTAKPSEYQYTSMIHVLNGDAAAEQFAGDIVLIGAYAPGMMDAYFVPVEASQQMYGVEIHANIIQAIMEQKMITAIPKQLDALIAAVTAGGLAWCCAGMSVAGVLCLCLGAVLIKLCIGWLLFDMGYSWNGLVIPVAAILLAVGFTGLQYYWERKKKNKIHSAFGKYVAPEILKKIEQNGEYELKLGGENREIAAMFVDIRGFTPLSESLQPEEVVEILNGYLELTTRCIFRHGGTLDKFIGDATMAIFNAPADTKDYIYAAVLTAWDIVQGGNEIEKKYLERYGKQVGFGVGVHCGPAVVGNIGCKKRMDYTAIGDTVNTAARLESNAPKGTVYISDTVYAQLKERILVEEVGEIPLKGKAKGVFVYAVTDVIGYHSPESEGDVK